MTRIKYRIGFNAIWVVVSMKGFGDCWPVEAHDKALRRQADGGHGVMESRVVGVEEGYELELVH